MIPPRLVRTVPAETTDEVEGYWQHARELHPGWVHETHRDPLDPDLFDLTAPHWARCTSGAQRAGLIRLEAIYNAGGIYIDSDLELYRPLNSLLGVDLFAGYEDGPVAGQRPGTIPDFVFGARPDHPIIGELLEVAIDRLDQGPWASGPGVFTEILPRYADEVLLLPPGSFAPYHYSEKHRRDVDHHAEQPWAFGAHHWAGSWL